MRKHQGRSPDEITKKWDKIIWIRLCGHQTSERGKHKNYKQGKDLIISRLQCKSHSTYSYKTSNII